MNEFHKVDESSIMENQLVMDFYDYPVVKKYGADLFQRNDVEQKSEDDSEQ